MDSKDFEVLCDSVAKFHGCAYAAGWYHAPGDRVVRAEMSSPHLSGQEVSVGLAHASIDAVFGPGHGFTAQGIFQAGFEFESIELTFFLASGRSKTVTFGEMARARLAVPRSVVTFPNFLARLRETPGARVLEVGGRARSGIDRRAMFGDAEVTVLDILPGANVDVVGDAHELDRLFRPDSFDAVCAISVFEHLLMPWKVVLAINRVLKPGGIVFIHTHQTIGLHDSPWDFWRLSSFAWDGLFNAQTGFEILSKSMDAEQYILPVVYRPEAQFAERAIGFEESAVLAQKIGMTGLSWDVSLPELVSSHYPDTPA